MTVSVGPYADQASAIVASAGWIEHAMLGTFATVVAVIAIAGVGFSMLFGFVSVRRGAAVALGCFILFGAPTIAASLRKLGDTNDRVAADTSQLAPEPTVPAQPPEQEQYDPYAGPGVPNR